MNLFHLTFAFMLCIALAWVTLRGQDAFPFSHYPMFSAPYVISKVKVYRLALEMQAGPCIWWESGFYRYPQYIGTRLERLYEIEGPDDRSKAIVRLQRHKLLIEVLRLMQLESGSTENFKSFHIIERTINERYKITDRTIEIISFNSLKNGNS